MDERNREGAAATLRAAGLIVIAGICLGLAFNALGLASRPPRGLSWIAKPERMPSLEELQPGSSLVPAPRPRSFTGLSLVGTAWADTTGATVHRAAAPAARPAAGPATKSAKGTAKSAKAAAKTTKAPVRPTTKAPAPVKPAIQPAATPAPAPAARVDLPVVPDLDQPIEVKLPNVKRFFDAGPTAAAIVDAREAVEYAAGHIPGALSVPVDDALAKPALLAPFKTLGEPIIAYCSGGDCEESKDLAKLMIAAGIRKVLVFTDGFPAWQAAGYPVEKGAAGAKR